MTNKKRGSIKEPQNNNHYISILSKEFGNDKRFIYYNEKKEPVNEKGYPISISNPNNLISLENALIGLKNSPKIKGIGIALGKTPKGNLCGIDIDNSEDENGKITKEAQEIITSVNSYTEISISGNGNHILFYAEKSGTVCKNRNLSWCKCLEMYDRNRFFIITGNLINDIGIMPRQEQCNAIYNKYFADKEKQSGYSEKSEIELYSKSFTGDKLQEYEIRFDSALLKDKKLSDYWNGKRPTNDESANDFGFIRKLAQYIEYPELIKTYFLKSPYFMTKDQKHQNKCLLRKDYLSRTIANVLARAKRKEA